LEIAGCLPFEEALAEKKRDESRINTRRPNGLQLSFSVERLLGGDGSFT
jgi:hypothetical protein